MSVLIQEITQELFLQHPQIIGFSYIKGYDDGSRVVLSTHQEIIESSPVLKNYKNALCLTDLDLPKYNYFRHLVDSMPKNDLYHEEVSFLEELMHFGDELIIRQHNPANYAEHFSFYYQCESSVMISHTLNHLDQLEGFARQFLCEANELIRMADNNLTFKPWRDLLPGSSKNTRPILTPRERQLALLLKNGHSVKQLADHFQISPRTAEKHLENIKVKFNLQNRSQLMRALHEYLV